MSQSLKAVRAISGTAAIAGTSYLFPQRRFNNENGNHVVGSRIVKCDGRKKPPPKKCLGDFREEALGIDFQDRITIGVSPNKKTHVLMSAAPRCMQGMCWFPPARAYGLALYVDEGSFNRIKADCKSDSKRLVERVMMENVEKTFVFSFTSQKDSAHVKRGFERSFGNYCKEDDDVFREQIGQFVSLLEGDHVEPGTTIAVTCVPGEPGRVFVNYSKDGQEKKLIFEGTSFHGSGRVKSFIHALHCLYLGDDSGKAKYNDIQSKLADIMTQRLMSVGCS